MAKEFKDLNELKEAVSQNKKSLEKITESINILNDVSASVDELRKNQSLAPINTIPSNMDDADIDGDGKVTTIELMVVQTLQGIAEKTQRNNIWMVALILGFLLASAILATVGIPLDW